MARYRGRVSGPLLDRIDLHVEVSRPKAFLLQHEGPVPESSGEVRSRVVAARAIQHQRACYHILRVARTLADLDNADAIRVEHLTEAISYRSGGGRAEPLY